MTTRQPLNRLAHLWPLMALAALVLLTMRALAFGGGMLGRGDALLYFLPLWAARDAALRAFTWPLWAPDVFLGVPLLANPQVGALYPANWLTVWLPTPDAARTQLLLHGVWAAWGGYWLARGTGASRVGAFVCGAMWGCGGALLGKAEQFNQYQGLAWAGWAFGLLVRLPVRPRLYAGLLGAVMALVLLAGHAQAAFIIGVGLGVVALTLPRRRLRVMGLVGAALLALLLSAHQLVPTVELAELSARGGGLSAQDALAFSWPPQAIGRGLLPPYSSDGARPFTEYVAYLGALGLALAVVGGWAAGRVRWPWLALTLVGVLLALGAYNPVNWVLFGWPGFNSFRVPARFTALAALGGAVLAGLGTDVLLTRRVRPRALLAASAVVAALMALARFPGAASGWEGAFIPPWWGYALWGGALLGLLAVLLPDLRLRASALVLIVAAELALAGGFMPAHDTVPRDVWDVPRQTAASLRALQAHPLPWDVAEPLGRLLSASALVFDPGDGDALLAGWPGLSGRQQSLTLTAVKLHEVLAPNLPLVAGVPSVDGYDGGLLPTRFTNAFLRLLLPPDADGAFTGDGRLWQGLARAGCAFPCWPSAALVQLADVRYVLTDKVLYLWQDGVAYDTSFAQPGDVGARWRASAPFTATRVHVLAECATSCGALGPGNGLLDAADGQRNPRFTLGGWQPLGNGLALAVAEVAPTSTFAALVRAPVPVRAVTLVDGRTGDFVQLAPYAWPRVLSSDVTLYASNDRRGRAWLVYAARAVNDVQAAALMRSPTFVPRREALLHTTILPPLPVAPPVGDQGVAHMAAYAPHTLTIAVHARAEGLLMLSEGYAPGWQATVNGRPVPVLRANLAFRAVPVPPGESTVRLVYRPWWIPLLTLGWMPWLMFVIAVTIAAMRLPMGLAARR